MKSMVAVPVLSVLQALIQRASGANAETLETTSGNVQGQIASGTNGVSEYLGIPYASPPTGELRWAPPVAFNGSSAIDATQFGSTCPATVNVSPGSFDRLAGGVTVTPQGVQDMISLLGQVGVHYSEDCLTLNVWTKPQTGEDKKAVLVWFYGGGYTAGTTNNTGYNGKYIADQKDVIVVTVNYRLGIFGFPGNPDIRTNLGLLDVRLAVEWVHDNIAAFGGDSDRITLFGQSAGASAVDYYAYAWESDPLVAGFICQSGTVLSANSQAQPGPAAASWYNVTATLGCGDASSDGNSVLDCMRSKNWADVQDTLPSVSGFGTSDFGPTVDNIVVFSDYIQRSAAGKLAKKPLMIGTNNNEAGLFKPILAAGNVTLSEAEWDFLQFLLFTCSSSERAIVSVLNKIPTWRYRYFGDFPNLELTTVPASGAWHGAEVPVIFGTDLDIQTLTPRTKVERQIATYMLGAWTAFAKDPLNGLNDYGFPPYSPITPSLVQLAYNDETGPQAVLPGKYDTGCVVATALLDILTDIGIVL